MEEADKLKSQIQWNLDRLPKEDVKEVSDFIDFLMHKKSTRRNKKLNFSWIGSLSHLKKGALELEEEAKKLWEKTD